MVDAAYRVVYTLLEMNVLNLDRVKAELNKVAAHAARPEVKKWLLTVAKNYIVNPSPEDAEMEYMPYTPDRPKGGIHTDMPSLEELPDWARKSLADNRPLDFFDQAQPRRRKLWADLSVIVDWFNNLDDNDGSLKRIDRVGFEQARTLAKEWMDGLQRELKNKAYRMVRDLPAVVKTYPNGYRWVSLTTEMHLCREGDIVRHCIYNSHEYREKLASGQAVYFSLRDPHNHPHVTLEVLTSNDGSQLSGHRVVQIKGKQNARPTRKYQPYVIDFLHEKGWPITGNAENLDVKLDSDSTVPDPLPGWVTDVVNSKQSDQQEPDPNEMI